MKLFLVYLKSKFSTIILLVVSACIISCVFLLYRLPLPALIYPLVLCFLAAVCFFIIDFIKTKSKHDMITKCMGNTAQILGELPQMDSLIEEDLKELVYVMQQNAFNEKGTDEAKMNNMIDYYTTWVHQIKTPISSMKLTLQNEDSAASRKLQSDLFRIEQYVEMVLVYLRLDSDSSDYVFKLCNLDNIVRGAVKKFRADFINKKLSFELEESGKMIITDEKWFSFIIEQILSNSLKYTKSGGVKVSVSGEELVISDTGIGIDSADIPRIFEKGFTGYNGRTDKQSSGLGLYLCKRIADSLGSGIKVESEVGKGTTVRIPLTKNRKIVD